MSRDNRDDVAALVRDAVAHAGAGRIEPAVGSLRAALSLDFDIELADAVGQLDGLPEGVTVDLVELIPSWIDRVRHDPDDFEVVVDFDIGPESAREPARDDLPAEPHEQRTTDPSLAAGRARARYQAAAPPPPAHRPSGRGAAPEVSAPDPADDWSLGGEPASASRSAGEAESLDAFEVPSSQEISVPSFSDWGDAPPPVPESRPVTERFTFTPVDQPAVAATPNEAVTRPPAEEPAGRADWGEEPSLRLNRGRATEPETAPAPRFTTEKLGSTPGPVEVSGDATPSPMYYDPLREAPRPTDATAGAAGFGRVRPSSIRRARPAEEVAPAPERLEDLLAAAQTSMRRGDLGRAEELIAEVLKRDPGQGEAIALRKAVRRQLANMRRAALEPLSRVPIQNLQAIMRAGERLNPRMMFFLNLVDGTMTLQDVIDLSGAPSEEAAEQLVELIEGGLIVFR